MEGSLPTTSPNTSSLDIGDDSGPYAQALASEFNRTGQDHLTLFQNVKERVFSATSATGNPQRPWENNGLLKRFYFAGPPAASDLAQEPPPEQVVAKEMVLVPAGPFEMGSTEEEVEAAYQLAKQYSPEVNKVWYEPEQPRHWVWVDAFYMDKHKVTLEEYQIFMREREKPYQELPDWTSKYANIPKHPVVGVSWEDAVGYCRWAGKQLPTEAQWEKAARGTDGRWYPWGSEPADGKRANYCDTKCEFSWKDKNQDDGYRYLSPVGAYELGKSFYGIYDLAGNVWEWVQDWYDVEYYSKSRERNPVNDKEAQYRVVRGGSWDSDPSFLRASYRSWREPNDRLGFVGFRCVSPAAPEH